VNRETIVLATLVLYQIALVLLGLLASRRTHDGADYFLGGRRLGPTVAALSASASSSSAWTLLSVSGAAYAWGLSALWLFPSCVGGFLFNWYVLAPRLRRRSREQDTLTVTDVLAHGRRRAGAIRTLASAIVVLAFLTYVASQYQGAGKAFSETFGMSSTTSILIGAGVIIVYTMLGGFWAVSLTDSLQGLLMVAASVALPMAALLEVGGFSGLVDGLAAVEETGYRSLTGGRPPVVALGFVLGLLGIGLGYPGQPHVANRFMAARDEKAIAVGRRVAIAWAVVVYAGMLLLGLCSRVLYAGLEDGERVFIHATHELFSPVLSGIIVAAGLSAMMSTADSQLLVAASSLTHDLELGGATAATLVRRSRWVVLGISLVSVALALLGSADIFTRVLSAWFVLGAAFGPLLLVTVWRGPVSGAGTLAAMTAGAGLSTVFYLLDATRGGFFDRVLPFLVALAIAYSCSEGSPGARDD
jgi:sodium/proline symporter